MFVCLYIDYKFGPPWMNKIQFKIQKIWTWTKRSETPYSTNIRKCRINKFSVFTLPSFNRLFLLSEDLKGCFPFEVERKYWGKFLNLKSNRYVHSQWFTINFHIFLISKIRMKSFKKGLETMLTKIRMSNWTLS